MNVISRGGTSTVLRGRAIVLFLPQPEPAPVAALRHQFDTLYGSLSAHITLVFPFESDLAPETLRDHVVQSVRGASPITVRLSEVTGADNQYLFLNVKRGNDALIDLHDRLYQGPLAAYRSRELTYLPHVTVGRLSGPSALQAALAIASKTSIDFEVTLDTVTVHSARTATAESQVPL